MVTMDLSNLAEARPNPGSDFVKKLYKMLEDTSYDGIVSWGYTGDTFVIKEMDAFTKLILPRHFKHSNFASFVRQLNKYDFHKVKQAEEEISVYGEQSWEFKHPDFKSHRRDLMDNIKRKTSNKVKVGGVNDAGAGTTENMHLLQTQIDNLTRIQQGMNHHLVTLTRNYQSVLGDVASLQRTLVTQDQLLQHVLHHLANLGSDRKDEGSSKTLPGRADGLPPNSFRAFYSMNRNGLLKQGESISSLDQPSTQSSQMDPNTISDPAFDPAQPFDPSRFLGRGTAMDPEDPAHEPTAQHSVSPDKRLSQYESDGTAQTPMTKQDDASPRRRPTLIPTWSTQPKVLLVEDDAVCRRLASKFLESLGCVLEVALDGIVAVNKMNMSKFDIVFMDIVMPNLDGVGATSLIRQFDMVTPIIAMTSNSNPNEILAYIQHGMNDILPKPFSRDALSKMLAKHIGHLQADKPSLELPDQLSLGALPAFGKLPVDATGATIATQGADHSLNLMSDLAYIEMLQGYWTGTAAGQVATPANDDGFPPGRSSAALPDVSISASVSGTRDELENQPSGSRKRVKTEDENGTRVA